MKPSSNQPEEQGPARRTFLKLLGGGLFASTLGGKLRSLIGNSQEVPDVWAAQEEPPEVFPPADEFHVKSHPIFVLDVGGTGETDEILVMEAGMDLVTGEPYVNKEGFRQVDIRVNNWVAQAKSEVLDSVMIFELSQQVEQPLSSAIAQQRQGERDFPATLTFNMVFNVEIQNLLKLEELSGVAEGTITRFPPKGTDIFFIEKELPLDEIVVAPVACAC